MALNYVTILIISLLVVLLVVVYPLFLEKSTLYFTGKGGYEFDESVSILEIIAELEGDMQAGKLSKEDFESLSVEFKREYLELKQGKSVTPATES